MMICRSAVNILKFIIYIQIEQARKSMFKICSTTKDDSYMKLKYHQRPSNPQSPKNANIYPQLVAKRSLRSVKSLNNMKTSQQVPNLPLHTIKNIHTIKTTPPNNIPLQLHPQQHNHHQYNQHNTPKLSHPTYIQKPQHYPQNQSTNFISQTPRNRLHLYKEVQFHFKPQPTARQTNHTQTSESFNDSIPMIKISQAPFRENYLSQVQYECRLNHRNPMTLSLIKQEGQNMLSTHFSEFNHDDMGNSRMLAKSVISMMSERSSAQSTIIERTNTWDKITSLL